MSTTQFKKSGEIPVQLPLSHSVFKLPENGMIIITVDKHKDITMSLDNDVLDYQNGLSEVLPGERKFTDYVFPPNYSAFNVLGPGVENLLNIYQAFSGWDSAQMRAQFAGMRYGDLKKQVAEMVVSSLEPLQKRYREIMAEPGYVDHILRQGAARVAPIANSTVELVKQRMGLYAFS